jgi:hypothetical protein
MLRAPVAIVLIVLARLACAQDAPALDPAVAGTVSLVEGDVRFLDAKQQARRPKQGDAIYEGEGIVTGTDGEVHLDMQDGGYIGVRPGTQLNIVNFKAEGGKDDGFVLSLFEGSFRAVTGWITRSSARRAEVQTPTVTIGVRGTDYEPLVIPEGSKTGEAGTYNRVNVGETEMRNAQGSVVVKPNQAGFMPRSGTARAPRLLDRVPAVFRTTRNEKRFEGLHARIHQNLEQKRQLRVKQVQERRRQRIKAAPAQKSATEQRREQERQREQAAKQQRFQEAQKRERQREAQKAALQAQKQVEERRRAQQDRERAAKKAAKHRAEKRE